MSGVMHFTKQSEKFTSFFIYNKGLYFALNSSNILLKMILHI